MGKLTLLIDYENVQNINLALVEKQNLQVKIFVGHSQSKLPLELVQSTQQFGDAVEWIKMEGGGSNSLDFHIAFYLGKLSKEHPDLSFTVLSKDKGFDPLIRYLCKRKIPCRRIEDLSELSKQQERKSSQPEDLMEKVLVNLSKVEKKKRPKSRNALFQHIKALLLSKKLSKQELETLINKLFSQKKITETNDRLTYNF